MCPHHIAFRARGLPIAEMALVYVSDADAGIRRVRRASGFAYRDDDSGWLRDRAALERIRKLAIPPAYESVWICRSEHGHLQATGRDARGRKQYRYHADWRMQCEEGKFDRLADFGRALPRIRARVAADLQLVAAAPPRALVLATVVRLLDATVMRIGNDAYARENGSYGLTTLRNQHVEAGRQNVRLAFRGKSGVEHAVSLADARVARVVRRCQQLPGQKLFRFVDELGGLRDIDSGDVNDYLAETAGERFTAKAFRTWHASVHALDLARDAARSGVARKPKELLAEVAARLGNTVTVCRKSYVHPRVLALIDAPESAEAQRVWRLLERGTRTPQGLTAAERRLLRAVA